MRTGKLPRGKDGKYVKENNMDKCENVVCTFIRKCKLIKVTKDVFQRIKNKFK